MGSTQKEFYVAVSGGPSRASFVWNDCKVKQAGMLDALSQVAGVIMQAKSNKTTDFIVIPDGVASASESKTKSVKADMQQVPLSEFMRDGYLFSKSALAKARKQLNALANKNSGHKYDEPEQSSTRKKDNKKRVIDPIDSKDLWSSVPEMKGKKEDTTKTKASKKKKGSTKKGSTKKGKHKKRQHKKRQHKKGQHKKGQHGKRKYLYKL